MRMMAVVMVAFSAAAVLGADTIHLRDGKTFQGEIVSYRNMVFEVRASDGAVQRFPQASVERIAFTPRPVQLDTRNQGKVEGEVRRYENAAFQVHPAKGAPLNVSTVVIKEILFGGEGQFGSAEGIRKIEKINRNGQRVDIRRHLVPGKVTIVDFYADWCGPCRQITPFLEDLAKNDPDVYLRKVDIDRWGSPVAEQHKINSIPRIEVYDRKGQEVPLAGPDRETAIRNAIVKAKAAR